MGKATDRLSVGFVGLGNQGGPIAERIIQSGFPLTVWARRAEAMQPFVALGATAAANLGDLGSCDILGICVVDDAGVTQVFDALLPALKSGAIVMILATIHPATCRTLAARAAEQQVMVIDTPVSGGHDVAKAGQLTVMAGGHCKAIARCRPVIESFSALIVHLGDVGAGQCAKLINNALLAAHLALADEAATAGVSLGLDRAALLTLLAASSGRSYGVEIMQRLPAVGAFAAGAALLRKDVDLLDAVGEAGGADITHIVETGNLFLAAVAAATPKES